jgi:hypothetical protein
MGVIVWAGWCEKYVCVNKVGGVKTRWQGRADTKSMYCMPWQIGVEHLSVCLAVYRAQFAACASGGLR